MIRITRIQKVEFRIAQLILSNSRLEFRSISCNETSGFVNNIFDWNKFNLEMVKKNQWKIVNSVLQKAETFEKVYLVVFRCNDF